MMMMMMMKGGKRRITVGIMMMTSKNGNDDDENNVAEKKKKSKSSMLWKMCERDELSQQVRFGAVVGPRVKLEFDKPVLSTQWHYKGDYLVTLTDGDTKDVVAVHQVCKIHYTNICTYIRIYVHAYICIHTVHIYIFTYCNTYIYMHIQKHMHTFIYHSSGLTNIR
jgi:hypothetical protein